MKIASLFRRLPLCRVRKSRVADWAILSSIDSSKQQRACYSSNRNDGTGGAVRQKITTIRPLNENPTRSNDGTSSGAIVDDRLRNARRYAIDNMIETFPKQKQPRGGSLVQAVVAGSARSPPQSTLVSTNEKCDTRNNNEATLSSMSDEDLIAELSRRRQRRVASTPVVDSSTTAENKIVREHGLVRHIMGVHTIENPVRSNDGTSSGAIVADRLRKARRKAIENLTTNGGV